MYIFLDSIIKNVIILLLGCVIFYIDDREFLQIHHTKLLILFIAIFKSVFFFVQSLYKIIDVSEKDIAFYRFLIFMGVNIFIVIISFTIDFICLYQVDPTSFQGFGHNLNFGITSFELFYLSVLGFNNLGFYDIVPIGRIAKSLVILETFTYISTIIFILSDFMSLKESMVELRKKRQKNTSD